MVLLINTVHIEITNILHKHDDTYPAYWERMQGRMQGGTDEWVENGESTI